jgi:hypothetical protein
MIADNYKQGFGSLYRLISRRWSRNSLPNDHNLIHSQCSNAVILIILADKTGQNTIYRHLRLSHAMMNYHLRTKIIADPFAHIFTIGQVACCFLSGLYRQPIHRLCITENTSLFNYMTYRINNP